MRGKQTNTIDIIFFGGFSRAQQHKKTEAPYLAQATQFECKRFVSDHLNPRFQF